LHVGAGYSPFLDPVQQSQTVTRQILKHHAQRFRSSAQSRKRLAARLPRTVQSGTVKKQRLIKIAPGSPRNQSRLRDHQILRGTFRAAENG
jgi:hypothetical protein